MLVDKIKLTFPIVHMHHISHKLPGNYETNPKITTVTMLVIYTNKQGQKKEQQKVEARSYFKSECS